MKPLAKALLFLIGVAVLAGGWVSVKQGSVVAEKNRLMAQNDAMIDSLRAEKQRLKARVKELSLEMATLPDSARAARTGEMMRESNRIGKRDAICDTRITRNRNMKRVRGEARQEALRGLLLWDGVLFGGALVLSIAYVLVKRRAV